MPRWIKVLSCLLVVCAWPTSGTSQVTDGYVVNVNQAVRVAGLPTIQAKSSSPSAILDASLATALMDEQICCQRGSVFEDRLSSFASLSLEQLALNLQGWHTLNSGDRINITAAYWSARSVTAETLITALMGKHPLLMKWKDHVYVLYGVIYDETRFYSGKRINAICALLLIDTQFADKRRLTQFDRVADDWGKVAGFLQLGVTRSN